MALELYINIYSDVEATTIAGSGPIVTATYWQSTSRMDAAGTFHFEFPATDPQRAECQSSRVVRAFANIDGTWTELGGGIINSITRRIGENGAVMLTVSGDDIVHELADYVCTVNFRDVGGGPISHSTAVIALSAQILQDDGHGYWRFTPDAAVPNDEVLLPMSYESVLFAATRLAEIGRTHFYLSAWRRLTYTNAFTASGIRAISAGELSATTCAITSLEIVDDASEYCSRIYARGTGNGTAEMDLTYVTRTAPTGYTLTDGYLQNDAAQTARPRSRKVQFKEVRPVTNTTVDIQAAANVLFDSAYDWLRRRCQTAHLYNVGLAQCATLLRPMQSIRISYHDPAAGIDVEEDLNIVEATIRIDDMGLRTTQIAVADVDFWPENGASAVSDEIQTGSIYSSAAQVDINSYALCLKGPLEYDMPLTYAFQLGDEITQIQSVQVQFRVSALEDVTSAVSSAATTGGPSAADTGAASPATNAAGTGNTGGATLTTNAGGTGNTGANNADTSSEALNTAIDGSGNTGAGSSHNHSFGVVNLGSSTTSYPMYMINSSGNWYIGALNLGGDLTINVSSEASHTHDRANHQHSIAGHTHNMNNHTHTGPSHTHTVDSHVHTGPSHTHTVDSHTHTLAAHTHTSPALTVERNMWRETTSGNILSAADVAVTCNGTAVIEAALTGGWYAADLTATIVDSVNRPAADLNTLVFTPDVSTNGKFGMLEAQIIVRCYIQAVAVS